MPPQQRILVSRDDLSDSEASYIGDRKRKLTFAMHKNQVFEIKHIKNMSKDEVKATWYQRPEFEAMKQSFIPIIRSMMKGEVIEESNEQTTRGLEFRTRKGAIRRQHNKLEAISAVLEEQDRQLQECNIDDEKLREVYLECSSHCLDEAFMLALQDEAMAREIYTENPEGADEEDLEEDEQQEEEESPEASSSDEQSLQDGKKATGLGKLFQQVRIRRRALLEDMKALEQARSMPQAA